MPLRTAIRRHALQLLYCLEEQRADIAEIDLDAFWHTALGKEFGQLALTRAKAVEHACRGVSHLDRQLHQKVETALQSAEFYFELARLREEIKRMQEAALHFEELRSKLHFLLVHKERAAADEMRAGVENVLRAAAKEAAWHERLMPAFDEVGEGKMPARPDLLNAFSSLKALLKKRAKVIGVLGRLAEPLAADPGSEYTGLVRQEEFLRAVSSRAEALVRNVLAQKEQLASLLEATVEHYVPSRMGTVDACILYISLYELLHAELPAPIVVSEATALADLFSGTKSARFIHGVIGAVVQSRHIP